MPGGSTASTPRPSAPMLRRTNHRGRDVAFPLGPAIICAGLVLLRVTGDSALDGWLIYLVGVVLLGLIDDCAGGRGPRGLREHSAVLLRGRPSTGALKAAGTLALAAGAAPGDGLAYLVDVGLLTLAPHVGNLLDLRPGRVEKAAALALVATCAGAGTLSPLALVWPFAVAVAVGAWFTLRERAMLGDSGASLVGALAGVCLVTALGPGAGIAVFGALIAISLYGEFRSLSLAIERVPLLARLDSLGRAN
jgi:UDP-GlcNAc:undecaprenyl-phosphate/decaprenyl-phosphate GlcNAc-1-phosphate transferase